MSVAKIVSTCFLVDGVNDDRSAKKALQALYDIFARNGMGQATFEIVPGEPTRLWIKHKDGATPRRGLLDEALAQAGNYRVIDE